MIRSLFLTLVFASFLILGLAAPFVFTLGYVWVDMFRPQDVAWFVLNQMPVALIMGGAAFAGYLAMDRRSPPHLTLVILLTLLLSGWVTATTFWAEVPDAAWGKWNWAFKSVIFSAFIPLVIRSRVQIEALVQTYVFSLAANFIPFGFKVMISGGGYGQNLGLMGGNANLSEGGLLSTVCLMAVPLALYLARNTQLLPRSRLVSLGYWGLAVLAVVTALGTFERSALIGLAAMVAYMFTRSRHKLLFGLFVAVAGAVALYSVSGGYQDRMSTIADPTAESSAFTRLLVWRWTFNYALSHPFGGGFASSIISRIEYPNGEVVFGRAFHSSYFELLGEQGWIGLGLFLTIAAFSVIQLRRLARRTRQVPHLAWCAELANALQAGLIAFLTSGAFVGIAYQPEVWYFIAASVSLNEYVRRVERPQQVTGVRARFSPAAAAVASVPPGRHRPA